MVSFWAVVHFAAKPLQRHPVNLIRRSTRVRYAFLLKIIRLASALITVLTLSSSALSTLLAIPSTDPGVIYSPAASGAQLNASNAYGRNAELSLLNVIAIMMKLTFPGMHYVIIEASCA